MSGSPHMLLALLIATVAVVAVAARRIGPRRRKAFLREAGIVISAYFAYFVVRGATEGDVVSALRHARAIENLERSLGLFVEPALQAAIVGERWLVDLANWVYVWGHWPIIGLIAIWLYYSPPASYRLFRNAFLISGAIGLAIFMTFPTAPPRLAGLGLVDTVVQHSNFYHLLQPPQLTNQYAAFPSLHFGWNLLIGIALVVESPRRWLRLFGAALPVAMLAAVVLTANHYVIDAVAGAAVALIGLGLAWRLTAGTPWARRRVMRSA